MRLNSYQKLIAVTITGITLVACKPACSSEVVTLPTGDNAELVDDSLLTNQPCQPPCWYGIVPGQTSHEEAADIVARLDFINTASISDQDDCNRGFACIKWTTALSDYPYYVGTILTRDELVVSISIGLEYEFTVSDLIDIYGPPDKVLINATPQGRCYYFDLIWLTEGITAGPENSADPVLAGNQKLLGVGYFVPTSTIENYWMNTANLPQSEASQQAAQYVDWDDTLMRR